MKSKYITIIGKCQHTTTSFFSVVSAKAKLKDLKKPFAERVGKRIRITPLYFGTWVAVYLLSFIELSLRLNHKDIEAKLMPCISRNYNSIKDLQILIPHKKGSFPLRIFSVNVMKSTVFLENFISSALPKTLFSGTFCCPRLVNPKLPSILNKDFLIHYWPNITQKIKFSIKDFFSKCDQILSKFRIWSQSLKKSLMKSFFLCAVVVCNWGSLGYLFLSSSSIKLGSIGTLY